MKVQFTGEVEIDDPVDSLSDMDRALVLCIIDAILDAPNDDSVFEQLKLQWKIVP